MNPLKVALVLLTTLLLSTGIVWAGDYKVASKAGELAVELILDKNPPITGKNSATITIKDAGGQAVTDASVRVEYGMAAMPGMPAMNYKSDAVVKEGVYQAPLELSMSGPWFVNAKILKNNKVSTAKFNIDVQ
jgi:hypothetical protein